MSCPASEGAAQVLGVAYTYEVSQRARRELTRPDPRHSAWTDTFSFFVKCGLDEAVPDGGRLRLRPGEPAPHWPEAELAALLGPGHAIVAYTLANDLTAFTVEAGAGPRRGGGHGEADDTSLGKCWPGSCALGPGFVPAEALGPVHDLTVRLRVERRGRVVHRDEYRTASSRRPFADLPDLIARRRQGLGDTPRPSKRVRLDPDGRLPAGTVILLGTGLIVPPHAYCRDGDRVTVSCDGLGELTNLVVQA